MTTDLTTPVHQGTHLRMERFTKRQFVLRFGNGALHCMGALVSANNLANVMSCNIIASSLGSDSVYSMYLSVRSVPQLYITVIAHHDIPYG